MAIEYPDSPKEILDRQRTDVQNALPDSDPFLRASFLLALLIGNAGRFWDIYRTIENLQQQLFPWSADDDFLRRFGLFKGRDKKAASAAEGLISVEGTDTTLIPEDTVYQTTGGNEYRTVDQDYEITEQILTVDTITRVGSVATVTVVADEHHYSDNMTVTIDGATQSEYNVTTIINVTGLKTFEYEVSGSPTTPATGFPNSTATFASVKVRSYDPIADAPATGIDKNIDEGGKLSLQSSLAGINNDAYVQYSKISGGSDEESNPEYRDNVNTIYANPVAHFNVAELERTTLSIPGVTRAFVKETTPEPGAVKVYFMRDDDSSPIPDFNERTQVKNELLKIKPAHMASDDLNVPQLTGIAVDFTFTTLDPNRKSMRDAIQSSLETYFREVTEPAVNITQKSYEAAITQTIDPTTGEFVNSYTLSAPVGDVTIGADEIGILGTITWS